MLGGARKHSMMTVVPEVPLAVTRSSVQRTRDAPAAGSTGPRPMAHPLAPQSGQLRRNLGTQR